MAVNGQYDVGDLLGADPLYVSSMRGFDRILIGVNMLAYIDSDGFSERKACGA